MSVAFIAAGVTSALTFAPAAELSAAAAPRQGLRPPVSGTFRLLDRAILLVNGEMQICAYRGYATPTHVFISGRVLENKPPTSGTEQSLWRDLLNSYRRFETDEVPNADVVVQFAGTEHQTRTDEEGYYHLELPRAGTAETLWLTAQARCIVEGTEVSAVHEIIAPRGDTEFGVISDLDDTVIETNVTSFLTAAKLTFMSTAKTRKPLEGVATLYASLQTGNGRRGANPIFYVSSSPWNLYDLLGEFMELNEIPKGPMFLRDYGIDPAKLFSTMSHRAKLDRTLKLLADFPELPFVLIGDSGQHDAGLYVEAATLHPHRIKAIYIRDVDPTTATDRDDHVREHIKTAAHHRVPMLLVPDSNEIAHHAAEIGLIPSRKEAEVQLEVAKDHERPNPGAAAVKHALGIETPADS